jgi:hypothetical protein
MNTTDERELIIAALWRFVASRPGLEFANYGDMSSYRAEMRSITKDRHQAERLLNAVAWRSITADHLKDAMRGAFSGRLSWDGKALSYCAGQYYPTEYRAAVCAVLRSALWDYWSRNYAEAKGTYEGCGDSIRQTARMELGMSIARRWFN